MYMWPDQRTGCDFDSTRYNKKFLFIVLLPDLVCRLVAAGYS